MSSVSPLDEAFNKMRAQLDWLVSNAIEQNKALSYLAQNAEENRREQGEGRDDQSGDRDTERLSS